MLLGEPAHADAATTPDYPKHPAPPARTLRVPEDYGTLAAAYSAAGPGDHISLASGDYSGDLTLSRSGAPDRPIVIRSRSTLGATLTGRITITGSHHWLYELKTNWNTSRTDGYAVNLQGSYVTITRCWFASNQAIQCDKNGRHHIWIGWNRFTGQNRSSLGLSHIFFDQPSGGKWSVAENGPNNIWIYRNFFWDNIGAGAEDHCVYFGHSKPLGNDIGRMLNVSIEYNLIHRDTKRTRGIYVKRGCDYCTIRSIAAETLLSVTVGAAGVGAIGSTRDRSRSTAVALARVMTSGGISVVDLCCCNVARTVLLKICFRLRTMPCWSGTRQRVSSSATSTTVTGWPRIRAGRWTTSGSISRAACRRPTSSGITVSAT